MHKRWYTYLLPLNAIPAVCFALLLSTNSYTQVNLILNPGFEDTVHFTPFTIYGPNYKLCKYWANASGGSCDYFSEFAGTMNDATTNISIFGLPMPDIYNGEAFAGSACVGMFGFSANDFPHKEYLIGKLSEPLTPGEDYCFSFMCRRSEESGYANCDFGLGLSIDSLLFPTTMSIIPISPVVHVDIAEANASEWLKIETHFTATEPFSFIYLGSFTPSSDIECVYPIDSTLTLPDLAYYVFDEFSLIKDQNCITSIQEENPVSTYTLSEFLLKDDSELRQSTFELFDLFGRLVDSGNCLDLKESLQTAPNEFITLRISYRKQETIFRISITP